MDVARLARPADAAPARGDPCAIQLGLVACHEPEPGFVGAGKWLGRGVRAPKLRSHGHVADSRLWEEQIPIIKFCQWIMFLLTGIGGLSTVLREHRGRLERKRIPMFTHAEVWRGIDRLAKQNGLTASGLARRAGLDPTTFNPSKRVTKQSKSRWPSTESLAKVLTATGTSFAEFVSIMSDDAAHGARPASQRLRVCPLDQSSASGLFDDAGFPVGDGWDEIDFPNLDDAHAYALEVRGDGLLPAYRDGDLLVISPAAQVRRQDRIILKSRSGETVAGILVRRTAQRIEVDPFQAHEGTKAYAVRDVAWLGRIVWVSQ